MFLGKKMNLLQIFYQYVMQYYSRMVNAWYALEIHQCQYWYWSHIMLIYSYSCTNTNIQYHVLLCDIHMPGVHCCANEQMPRNASDLDILHDEWWQSKQSRLQSVLSENIQAGTSSSPCNASDLIKHLKCKNQPAQSMLKQTLVYWEPIMLDEWK